MGRLGLKGWREIFAMIKIKSINDQDPTFAQNRIPFDNLTFIS